MLSEMYIRLESDFSQKVGSTSVSMARIRSPAEQFVESISRVPSLIKTCLLIRKDSLRCRIFAYSFMRRLLLKKEMVGDWIVYLFANAKTSSRALEYFEELSNLTPSVALGISKPKATDNAEFHDQLEQLIVKNSECEEILPKLFLLNEADMKRACSVSSLQIYVV